MSKGLEALERIQCNYVHVFKARENGKTQLVHDLNTIKKELKALEIIKSDPTFVMYVLNYHYTHWDSKEEYDLLKEALL